MKRTQWVLVSALHTLDRVRDACNGPKRYTTAPVECTSLSPSLWPKMEYRSRLPGEPSLDHPGVPTGRLGHRAGLKTVGGIFRRFFCGLPALPARCSDPGVGARSTGKHRSPQTAPRLQGPNIGSNEPGRSPEVMLDAFRASLTWSVELSGSLRSVTLSLFRAGAGASGVVLA